MRILTSARSRGLLRTLALAALCLGLLGSCGGKREGAAANPGRPGGEARVLNVYNWSDYVAPDTISRFERETGIKVNYDVYDTNEVLETKLLTGHSGYDVVVPSAFFLERQAKEGVFLALDKSKLTNYHHLDPDLLQRLKLNDPDNRYGIPYMWQATGIGYNIDKVRAALGPDAPVDSWALVFDPKNAAKLQACGITFVDSPPEVLDSAQIYLGIDPNSERLEDLAAAENLVKGVRPFIRYFHSSQYINDLANGEVCVSIGYTGDVLQARDRAQEAGNGVRIAYSVPKEGAIFEADLLAIPADAPHPDNAHKFLDYIMRPDVVAEISTYKKYPSGNLSAIAQLPPAIREDSSIYPPPEVRARFKDHRAESLTYTRYENRAWTRIRTGR
jgi:putrescine transport system substrate-binding protein